jgi:hypothetical protein
MRWINIVSIFVELQLKPNRKKKREIIYEKDSDSNINNADVLYGI